MGIEIVGAVILAHLVGDYIFQDDAMASKKTSSLLWATLHGVTYTIPFLLLTLNPITLAIICVTHIIIDRWRLAKYLIWARNQLTPKEFRYSLAEAKENAGYAASKPQWMAVWLMIIVDNTVHIAIAVAAIALFG